MRKHADGLACDDFYAQHYLYIRIVNKWLVPTSYEKSIVFETIVGCFALRNSYRREKLNLRIGLKTINPFCLIKLYNCWHLPKVCSQTYL